MKKQTKYEINDKVKNLPLLPRLHDSKVNEIQFTQNGIIFFISEIYDSYSDILEFEPVSVKIKFNNVCFSTTSFSILKPIFKRERNHKRKATIGFKLKYIKFEEINNNLIKYKFKILDNFISKNNILINLWGWRRHATIEINCESIEYLWSDETD